MNKAVILISATILSIGGAYIPFLWGDTDLFSGWSILLGTVTGLIGIWLGIWISRQIG
jgi:hypothetical protein